MAPGKISKHQKPTGSVEGSSFRKHERKPTRQSTRLSKKAAPQDPNTDIEDEHEDIHDTPSQNMQRVLKSSVKKIIKKPTEKRLTKKTSNNETVLKAHQMFINELLSTNDDEATVLNPVLSTPTADESGESVQAVTFNNTGIQSHSNDSYDAEAFYAAVDSHVLQLVPDHKFESPHPFANALIQIKELNTDYEFGSPAPSAHNQQFNLDLNIGSPSQPAHIQKIDPTLDFGSPASFPHFEQLHPNLDLGFPTLFAPNQLYPGLEFGSPTPSAHDRQFNTSSGFGSPASFGQFRQLQPSLESGSLAHPAHVRNLDSAFELGSPFILEYAQQYNQRLDSEPPQSFKFFQLQKDASGTEKLPNTTRIQALDPRLQAEPLLDFQDKEYDPARNPHHHNYIHNPGSSFLIESPLPAQNEYHYSQTDMSASSPEDETKYAPGSSSPAAFHQQIDKDDNGSRGDGICVNSLNGHRLPEVTHQPNHYNKQHARNITNENASYPSGFYCGKPMGKSPEQINGLEAMVSSRLVDELTYNGAGVYPGMINSRDIEMGLQPMTPYYPAGKLSLAESLRARQRQQGIAHDNDHANNSGLRNASNMTSTTQASIAPILKHETEAESEPTESSIDRSMDVRCSVEAAQKGLWHEAMNRHGIYRPRGMVRVLHNGITQWREHEMTRWCNAVKYEDIRGQLLVECAELGQYTYPREKGTATEDITAFHPDQKDWAFEERHLRPDILHQYEKRGYQNPCYPVQIWLYHGAVVLDNQNQPILDFKNMPKAISSQVEGGLQEAITRQDSRIEANDFRVRMLLDPKGRGVNSTPCLSAIGMRRSRFRWRAGYLSWTPRTGSDDLKKYLDSILPAHCKAANSTRDFRELKPSEVKKMTLENRGKYLSRAGKRLLSPAARKKSEKTFRIGLRRAEIKDGVSVEELGGEDEEEEMTDSSTKVDPPLRPTMARPRQWMRDMSDQELEEHRKRIMKIFAPHRESWKDLDSLQKFTVDSWTDLEEVGAITYDGKEPVLNYGVIRELIKHILDGKRVSEYYLFREYDENAARLLG